jgi:hypothetical protein
VQLSTLALVTMVVILAYIHAKFIIAVVGRISADVGNVMPDAVRPMAALATLARNYC